VDVMAFRAKDHFIMLKLFPLHDYWIFYKDKLFNK